MRYRWRLQRRSAVWRVLLVGSRSDAENYLRLVREHPEWNLRIVDVVSASPAGTAIRQLVASSIRQLNGSSLTPPSQGGPPSRRPGPMSSSAMLWMK